jgi:hypothetical protein
VRMCAHDDETPPEVAFKRQKGDRDVGRLHLDDEGTPARLLKKKIRRRRN